MGFSHNKALFSRYRGQETTALTTHHIQQLLPKVLEQIGRSYQDRADLILASWPEIIGSQLSVFTQALSFREGILTVSVKNSTLYSLLNQHDKPRILKNLRDKFPNTTIKTILFKMG
jgi:hypothetical protein